MKTKYLIAVIIFLVGAALAGGVLFLPNFFGNKLATAVQNPQWTQEAGDGILVPACNASVSSLSCASGKPVIQITIDSCDQHAISAELEFRGLGLPTYGFPGPGGEGYYNAGIYACGSIAEWSVASPGHVGPPQSNTTYYWATADPDFRIHPYSEGSFTTPNCAPPSLPGDFNLSVGGGGGLACNSVPLSWTASSGADGYRILRGAPRVDISPYQPYTALNFTDTSVSQNTAYQYQIEAYNGAGTNRSNETSVTTPYCSPTLNFSSSPTSIFTGQSTTLTWSTSYVTSCVASGAWSGSKAVNGSEVVIPSPPPSVTYTLTCTGTGGSTGPQSVVIDVLPLALPDWIEIIPR